MPLGRTSLQRAIENAKILASRSEENDNKGTGFRKVEFGDDPIYIVYLSRRDMLNSEESSTDEKINYENRTNGCI